MEAVKKLEEQWATNQRKQSNEASTSGGKDALLNKSPTREVMVFTNDYAPSKYFPLLYFLPPPPNI